MNSRTNEPTLPLVSVIVPLYNEARRVPRLLAALQQQTYARYEIILVDNASTDGTSGIARACSGPLVSIVSEAALHNPEAARNTGVRAAKGSVLAFTDGDCLPDRRWLEEGVRPLRTDGADLVAGRIDFEMPRGASAAQVYDSVSFLQHEDSVANRGIAFTCNLLMRRQVFDTVGGFAIEGAWTGDSLFTRSAVRLGFSLVYAPRAIVTHPVRSWRGLVAKTWRIAACKGYGGGRESDASAWAGEGRSFLLEPKPHLRNLNPRLLAATLRKRFGEASVAQVGAVLSVAWGVAAVGALGFVSGRCFKWLRRQPGFLSPRFHTVGRQLRR